MRILISPKRGRNVAAEERVVDICSVASPPEYASKTADLRNAPSHSISKREPGTRHHKIDFKNF